MTSLDTHSVDVLVIGGGIAGASAAYEISGFASVAVLEQESQCGYHSTGRSAASFTENYGNDVIRRLVIASRAFLSDPPEGFSEQPLLGPRGMITVARKDQLEELAQALVHARLFVPSIVSMSPTDARLRVPVLRSEYIAGAIFEPESMEIDVNSLHQGFLRAAKARGAKVWLNAGVQRLEREGNKWLATTPSGRFAAPLLVNAAGAWADTVAIMAGVRPLDLMPKRRTVFNVRAASGVDVSAWPMVNDISEQLYFKPSAGQLLVSPADATPWHATDVHPDEHDIAVGIDRLETMTTLDVKHVSGSWAGLRTFAADGSPVVGRDRTEPSFVWLAAQGGYGIKTSPALSRTCADLIRHDRLGRDLLDLGLSVEDLSPNRLRPAAGGSSGASNVS